MTENQGGTATTEASRLPRGPFREERPASVWLNSENWSVRLDADDDLSALSEREIVIATALVDLAAARLRRARHHRATGADGGDPK